MREVYTPGIPRYIPLRLYLSKYMIGSKHKSNSILFNSPNQTLQHDHQEINHTVSDGRHIPNNSYRF